jgi:glycosyltransferase involved in cell wall biosynthesis
MLYFALFLLVATLLIALRTLIGSQSIQWLSRVSLDSSANNSDWPKVSIVVAARNEQRDVEGAVNSLLKMDYPDLQLIAVDDRSTDSTGEILDRLADIDSRLSVVHVDELPAGWLGKNNAQHLGAQAADGDYLLFTDADVVFDPLTLRRAITYARANRIDHLTATPQTLMPGAMLSSFATSFTICFVAYFPPWNARNPKSQTAVGIGAFNLVRREAYIDIGGHERIRMRPDDDIKLGKVLKQSGYRQEVVNGHSMICVPWYRSIRDVVIGLEKNTFSGVNYSVLLTVVGSSCLLIFHVWPFVALLFATGVTWWIYLIQCVLLWILAVWTTTIIGVSWRCCFLHPVTMGLIAFIMWRTMILTFRNDGIRWRDTHYSLKELRANQI